MKTDRGRDEPKRIIVLGALSAIAEASARYWAEQGASLLIAGRNEERLRSVASDLAVRGARVEIAVVDFSADDPELNFAKWVQLLGGADAVLVAYGALGEQTRAESNLVDARNILNINFTSACLWCLVAARYLEQRRGGVLIVLGSVAGDRGRASNYVYGAAKAGLGVLVQGIAHRLAPVGARAVLVKPGFVDTPMTAHIARKGLLWARPEAIGQIIVRISERPSGPIVYAPWYWRWIMLAIRMAPANIFHRTRL